MEGAGVDGLLLCESKAKSSDKVFGDDES